MMYWILVLHVIIIINVKSVLAEHGRSLCLKSIHNHDETEGLSCDAWSSISDYKSLKRYFTSNTSIRFLPGIYHVKTTWSIISVTNLSITGSEVNKTPVIIKCFNNNNNNSLSTQLINIVNSKFVQIRHIKFVGCGRHMKPEKNRDIFPSTAATAMFLYNVESIRLTNVTFENSYGHDIFGLMLWDFLCLRAFRLCLVN